MNPGLSAINQTLLFSSNYFILPCGVDYFSKQAIKSLSNVLPNWANWSIKAKEHFKDSVYPLPQFLSKFLGYTVNNFNVKNKNPAFAVQQMIDDLDTEIKDVLLPKLRSVSALFEKDGYDYKLAQIKSFNTLQQVSHKVSKPVFALTSEDTGNTGIVKDTQELSINDVDTLFEDFYKELIGLIG